MIHALLFVCVCVCSFLYSILYLLQAQHMKIMIELDKVVIQCHSLYSFVSVVFVL